MAFVHAFIGQLGGIVLNITYPPARMKVSSLWARLKSESLVSWQYGSLVI